jgi:hypothetical protein
VKSPVNSLYTTSQAGQYQIDTLRAAQPFQFVLENAAHQAPVVSSKDAQDKRSLLRVRSEHRCDELGVGDALPAYGR